MAEKKKKSLGKRIILFVLAVIMLAASGFFLWQVKNEVGTTFSLLSDIEEAKKELAALQKEQEFLLEQKEKLMDDNYVKTWARGEYLITKEGEEIYKLPSTNN